MSVAICSALGVGFTLALFLAIAGVKRPAMPPTQPPPEEVRVEELNPPPPEGVPDTAQTAGVPLENIEIAPAASQVRIAAQITAPVRVVPQDLDVAPLPRLKPGAPGGAGAGIDRVGDPRYVFSERGVDQVPLVLARTEPRVPAYVWGRSVSLACTLIAIVNADGSVARVRILKSSGSRDFDRLAVENFDEWSFAPALKRGKRVRCLIEQYIHVQASATSPFQT